MYRKDQVVVFIFCDLFQEPNHNSSAAAVFV